MPMCGLPFFLFSSPPPPPAGPVAVDRPMADGWGEDAKGSARQTPLRVLVWHGSNAHSHPLKHHQPCLQPYA
eukprot:scaffold8570_cov111-Isochrysis_galbana.AAC.1